MDQFDREREDDGGAALAGDIEQRAEIAQLHRLRHLGQDAGGLDQLLRRLLLAFGIDDLGTALALGLGLAGDGTHHALVEVDALELDIGDLDAPGFGLFVEHVLDAGIELVALGQHLVEVVLAQYPAQRGLGELAGGDEIVPDLDDGALGIDDAEIDDGRDLDRDVVAGNHVLRRHLIDDDAQIDAHHLLDERHQEEKAGSLGSGIAAEREDDAAFVFAQHADRGIDENQHQYGDDDDGRYKHDKTPCSDEFRSDRFDEDDEAVADDDFHRRAGRKRRVGPRQPNFALDPHPALVIVPGHRLARRSDQGFAAGHHRAFARAQQHGERQEEERGAANGGADHDRVGQREARRARGEHHQRADDESGDAADADGAEGADMSLGDHQADADEDQRRAGIVDWQQRQGVKRDHQADRADETRRHGAGIEEFEDQPVDADQQQDEGNVGIGDDREQLGAPVGRHGDDV